MDLTTLFGLLLAVGGIVGGQLLEGGRVGSLLQLTAFVIVVFGTLGAVMVQSPLPVFLRSLKLAKGAFLLPASHEEETIDQVVEWAHVVRKEGLLHLESRLAETRDRFSRSALQMLVDGFDATTIRAALDVEIGTWEKIEKEAARVWEAAGGYAPTVGILGAVLGLIHVMENLADPSKLGAGIAVAFVATVYGVALANLVFLPIAGKLKSRIVAETKRMEMVQDGVVGIAAGENPRLIAARLAAYVGR